MLINNENFSTPILTGFLSHLFQNGLTPLHIAAHYDNVDVAMLLLDHGASPHTAAKVGSSRHPYMAEEDRLA